MNKASTIKILVASCMGITLIALLAIALFSDIPVSLQVFAVCVSIYGFLNYANGLKNKFQLCAQQRAINLTGANPVCEGLANQQ